MINYVELKDWQDNARSGLKDEIDRLTEKEQQLSDYMRALETLDELLSEVDDLKREVERKQEEIDDLAEQLEQKQQEIDELHRQKLVETGHLRQQLLDAKELNLEAEANAKPTEIHNHFESGSSAQVFNDKVTGKFSRKQNNKKDKKEKKRWKKIARKVL